MGYTGLASPQREQPEELGLGSQMSSAAGTPQPGGSAGDAQMRSGLGVHHGPPTLHPTNKLTGLIPRFLLAPWKEGQGGTKGVVCKPDLKVLAWQPGTGMVGSVGEGWGGHLTKNLKNKHVCVCFQVLHTRLKTIGISWEICKVQRERLGKN